jgi:hypothetical protein
MPTCLPPCLCSFAPHTFNLYRLFGSTEKSEAENLALKQHKISCGELLLRRACSLAAVGFRTRLVSPRHQKPLMSTIVLPLAIALRRNSILPILSRIQALVTSGSPKVHHPCLSAPKPSLALARSHECPPHHPTKDEPVVTTTQTTRLRELPETKSHTMSCLVSLVRQFDVYALAAGYELHPRLCACQLINVRRSV